MRKGFSFTVRTVIIFMIAIVVLLVLGFMLGDYLGVAEDFTGRMSFDYGNLVGGSGS